MNLATDSYEMNWCTTACNSYWSNYPWQSSLRIKICMPNDVCTISCWLSIVNRLSKIVDRRRPTPTAAQLLKFRRSIGEMIDTLIIVRGTAMSRHVSDVTSEHLHSPFNSFIILFALLWLTGVNEVNVSDLSIYRLAYTYSTSYALWPLIFLYGK